MWRFTASWTGAIRRPKAGPDISKRSSAKFGAIGVGRIATVVGRYYAMDRDKRWERIERAKGAMVQRFRRKSYGPGGRREALLRARRHR